MYTFLIVSVNTFAIRLFLYLALMCLFTLQLNLLLIISHLSNVVYSGSSVIDVVMRCDGKMNP